MIQKCSLTPIEKKENGAAFGRAEYYIPFTMAIRNKLIKSKFGNYYYMEINLQCGLRATILNQNNFV